VLGSRTDSLALVVERAANFYNTGACGDLLNYNKDSEF